MKTYFHISLTPRIRQISMILLLQQQIFFFKAQRIRAVTSHILQLRYILFLSLFQIQVAYVTHICSEPKIYKSFREKELKQKNILFLQKSFSSTLLFHTYVTCVRQFENFTDKNAFFIPFPFCLFQCYPHDLTRCQQYSLVRRIRTI